MLRNGMRILVVVIILALGTGALLLGSPAAESSAGLDVTIAGGASMSSGGDPSVTGQSSLSDSGSYPSLAGGASMSGAGGDPSVKVPGV